MADGSKETLAASCHFQEAMLEYGRPKLVMGVKSLVEHGDGTDDIAQNDNREQQHQHQLKRQDGRPHGKDVWTLFSAQ